MNEKSLYITGRSEVTQEEYDEYVRLRTKIEGREADTAEFLEKQIRNLEYAAMNMRNELAQYARFYGYNFKEEGRKDIYHISSVLDKNVLKITLPHLLPHRKERPNIPFLEVLEDALCALKTDKSHDYNRFIESVKDDAVIVFNHSYKNQYAVRDNDNIECKGVLDVIYNCGFVRSDAGTYLTIVHGAKIENDDFTTIYVMSKHKFIQKIIAKSAKTGG